MRKIIIDPGHGGHDPGAVNNDGLDPEIYFIEEKHLTLRLGQLLRRRLMRQGEFCPRLTRTNDRFVSLQQRVRLAEGAEAFLSIHHNARLLERPGIELETWYCWAAQRALAKQVQRVLVDRIGKATEVIDRGVKQGIFYVLRNLSIPAALVEIGFISDGDECIWLSDSTNQRLVARALGEALEAYFDD